MQLRGDEGGRARGRVKTLPDLLLCATQSSRANRNINGGLEHH